MPTNQQIDAARLQGAIARNEVDQLLLPPDQRAQNQPVVTTTPGNITGVGRLFSNAFDDGQEPPAAPTAPTAINSRTGQHPSIANAQQQQQQCCVITTDVHARVVAPPLNRRNSNSRCNHSGSQRRRQTPASPPSARRRPTGTQHAAAAQPDPEDDPGNDHTDADDDNISIPQDVLDDMERERIEAEGGVLWDEDAITADINHVVNSRISKRTRKSYDDYTVRLIIFLFDHREKFPALIPPRLLTKLEAAALSDLQNTTRAGRPKAIRKFIRKAIRDCFQMIDPTDSSTHPINLEEMDFRTLAHFLSTFSKKATRVNVNGEDTVVPHQPGDDPSQVVHLRLGPSSYDSVTSSLANLYKECKVPRDINEKVKDLWATISVYKKGAARDGAKQRKEFGLRTSSGKDPMPFGAYELLCSILHRSRNPQHIAAHLFLTLDWNMLSRVDFIVSSNVEFIGMSSDALRFDVGLTKTDQEGKNNIDHPFHVYSCPENPVVCPVLAMAKHLVKNPRILVGNCKLFKGSNQYEHYFSIFRKIVNSPQHRQSFIDRGLDPKYFGTHSIRKGAVTHIASGVTSSPPIASICIRANWKMPGVMNRYIKWESAGDQYVGRCVSGRKRLDKTFAESIPYFDFSSYSMLEKEVKMRELDQWIKDRMLDGGENESIFFLFKSCLASLIYHRSWLNQTIHDENAIRISPFWYEDIPYANLVTTRYPWTRTEDTPEFTGIPVDVLYLAKIEEQTKRIEELEQRLKADNDRVIKAVNNHLDEALDARAVGGESYGMAKTMMEKLDQLIETSEKAFNDCIHNAAAPFAVGNRGDDDDDDVSFAGLAEEVVDFTPEEETVLHEQALDAAAKERSRQHIEKRKKNQILVGYHKGVLTPLLPEFKYHKKMNLKEMIDLWLVGNRAEHVPPFRVVTPKQVHHFDKNGKRLHDMKQFMQIIKKMAVDNRVWKPQGAKDDYWNSKTVIDMWNGIYDTVAPYLMTVTKSSNGADSTHKSRPDDQAWRTTLRKIKAAIKKGELVL
ncbi:hypothetical protein ACHAWO_008273 [Cyclotella atomus]|uniref:Core-binding (CB) domain-containing protein n=1 Tax=Cyclotella atomus TaxID=382360 RepID=A0ABD3PYD1_9STRA